MVGKKFREFLAGHSTAIIGVDGVHRWVFFEDGGKHVAGCAGIFVVGDDFADNGS